MRHIVDLGRINPNCAAPRHGTTAAYRYGCHCPHAHRAQLVEDKRRRTGRHVSPLIDPTGTQRRLQGLCAIGWTYASLAERLDCTWQAVQKLAVKPKPKVHRRTARQVTDLYRELSTVPGPSQITRGRAAAKGWVTPIEWDNIDDPAEQPQADDMDYAPDERVDEVAVRRALKGEIAYRHLSDTERVEAYRRLVAVGATPAMIRGRLRVNGTTMRKLLDLVAAAEQTRVAA